jgi:uncharacterized membrane protein YhhN
VSVVSIRGVAPTLVAFAVSGALALYALEHGRRRLALVTKPLTTILLLLIVGRPTSRFSELVCVGLVASVAGDAVLLGAGPTPFMIGLGFFLIAHLAYVAAFATVGVWSAAAWAGLGVVVVATPVLIRVLWPRVGSLRGPVLAYAAALSAMVVAAFSTLGGALPDAALAALGAVLFYVSDASLAVNRFVRPIRYASLLSVGVYWLGQLGIALAARGRAS